MDHALHGPPLDRPTAELAVLVPGPQRAAIPAPARPHPLTGRQVVVIGLNYAPEPTGNAPYTTAMAEHLAGHAGGLSVITGMPHYPTWTLAPEYRRRRRSHEDVALAGGGTLHLQRLRHYVPARPNALTRIRYEASFLVSAMSAAVPQRPDLVIAVTPGLSAAAAGARLARHNGAKLLVVVQDLTGLATRQSGIRGGRYVARAAAAIERSVLTQAHRLAIVSEGFREQLHAYGIGDDKISLLPNWTHIAPSPLTQAECRRDLGWAGEPFTVVHTGNIGLKQDLGNLVEAARLARPGMEFVIVGDGNQRAAVQARAAGLANLRFVDPLDAGQYPKALAAADVLVVNERPEVGEMSLPSKLTSYLSAGRPVIAAVAAGGATARELRRTGDAALIVPAGDPRALAEGLHALRLDPTRRARMSAAGKIYAATTLGRDRATARLDAVIGQCLSPGAGR